MQLAPIDTEETETAAPPSLRDALDASYDAAAQEEGIEEPTPGPEATEPREGETQEEAEQRARDEGGRFAKQPKAKKVDAKAAPVKPTPIVTAKPKLGAPAATQPVVPEMKAPQSWREGAKKEWAQMSELARVEVLKREKDHAALLATTGEERKYASTMRQAFAPFEAQIRAEGSTPEKAIGNLMNTAMLLRTGPAHLKAQAVADMINTYGVPLEGLVNALSAPGGQGRPPQQGQPQYQQQQNFDPAAIAAQVRQQLAQELGAGREQALVAKSVAEVDSFLDGKAMHGLDGADYSEQIRDDMGDIIELRAKRGLSTTLEQAYGLVAHQHPEVSKVLERQKTAAAAARKNQSTQQVRAAASSVRSNPATTPVSSRGQGRSLREDLEAAVDSHE